MLVIPAIDLRNGKCVRLVHGDADKETIYSDNPTEMAIRWKSDGALRLHVIDLDGAFEGQSKNLKIVSDIVQKTGLFIQLGGGLRTRETIQAALDCGVERVILGTIVFTDTKKTETLFKEFSDRIIVALDSRDGVVSIKGWKENTNYSTQMALSYIEELGGKEVIYTDISRDGTLAGVNLPALKTAMEQSELTIYAAGGVTSIKDVEDLIKIGSPGCITGKAIYEGTLNLKDAIKRTQAHAG